MRPNLQAIRILYFRSNVKKTHLENLTYFNQLTAPFFRGVSSFDRIGLSLESGCYRILSFAEPFGVHLTAKNYIYRQMKHSCDITPTTTSTFRIKQRSTNSQTITAKEMMFLIDQLSQIISVPLLFKSD